MADDIQQSVPIITKVMIKTLITMVERDNMCKPNVLLYLSTMHGRAMCVIHKKYQRYLD